jgi:hypothetical protein
MLLLLLQLFPANQLQQLQTSKARLIGSTKEWKIFLSYRPPKSNSERLNMKLRIIKLTPESLAGLLQGKASNFTSNLPSDAEILDIKMDLFVKQISIAVRSESFEDIAENLPIPEFSLSKSIESKTASKPVITVRPQTIPESTPKPTIAKSIQPQPNRYAAKMENEFSPEQRKLLSFTVKDDCVVVKPVVFLKTEWDDINEVVRSVGGKWVKGDIISYWEIPLQ